MEHAMQLETVIPVIVAVISSIVGPLVVFFVGKRYTDGVIIRNNRKIKDQIEDAIIGDYALALDKLKKIIVELLEARKGSDRVELDLYLIAVAMTYSWEFIDEELPKILDKYSFVSINLLIAFVDGDYLSKLDISREGKDWGKISLQREKDIPTYKRRMLRDCGNQFSCEFRTYANIPHWHGWLVKEKGAENNQNKTVHLLLGRTRWEHKYKNNKPRKSPKLTVGQNEYRYYTNNFGPGASRISLFEQWHYYYFERAYRKKIGSNAR
jgi:hypothetical protein